MPELLISPQITTPSIQAHAHETSSHGRNNITDSSMPEEASPSFAATLKSLKASSEKKPVTTPPDAPQTSKKKSIDLALITPSTEPLNPVIGSIANEAPEISSKENLPATDTVTLLSLLQPDTSAVAAPVSTTTAPPSEKFVAEPALKPLASTTIAVSPAPTFLVNPAALSMRTNHAQPTDLSLLSDKAGHEPSFLKIAALPATSAEATAASLQDMQPLQPAELIRHATEDISNRLPLNFLNTQTNTPAMPLTQELTLGTPFNQLAWRDEIGQKLTWMISHHRQQAELMLNPTHLGLIEVTLVLDGNQASASFNSPHPGVRESLENSIARLRETLADAGITLGQTHVGAESRRHSAPTDAKNIISSINQESRNRFDLAPEMTRGSSTPHTETRLGLVNIFV